MNDNVRKIFNMLGVEPYEKFKIKGRDNDLYCLTENLSGYVFDKKGKSHESIIEWLLRYLLINPETIIKLPKKKHVGDLKCEDVECKYCPLYSIHCFPNPDTLNDVLEKWLEVYEDKELYKILKARLDKEVEE